MNIKTDYTTGYYVAEVEFPTPGVIATDPYGSAWYPDIDAWCEQTFGEMDFWGQKPVNGWKRMRNKYFFTEQKYREWFVLRFL